MISFEALANAGAVQRPHVYVIAMTVLIRLWDVSIQQYTYRKGLTKELLVFN